MPIKQITPKEAIQKTLEDKVKNARKAIIERFVEAGEECVNVARISHTYTDQTGNLTSSIGYIVIVDGQIIHKSDFTVVKKGYEGSASGKEYSESIASMYPRGIVLVVVAGKNYAQYVSRKGYDVLDSAELSADRLVFQLLSDLGIQKS